MDFGKPWRNCAVEGGWDGICDRNGMVLFKRAHFDERYTDHLLAAVNAITDETAPTPAAEATSSERSER